ncbi:MAG: hypothetical protein EA349_13360 [Halomonadaceae bacterium]|nr:MAG: hypothetical protein EA349_13360 [Halomonadaceae bacterium]
MSMIEKRLIGLSDEVALERRLGIKDLHIGWQVEGERQYQADPEGRMHIAPVIRFQSQDRVHRVVPVLRFLPDNNPEVKLRRFFGLTASTPFRIDGERLLQDIEAGIRRILDETVPSAA